MIYFREIFESRLLADKENFNHHAFILAGDLEIGRNELLEWLETKNFIKAGNSNLFRLEADKMLLKHATMIREEIILKTPPGEKKLFVISFSKINREAENALLKTFEEPPLGSIFFLIIRKPNALLPTTLSRFELIKLQKTVGDQEKTKRNSVGPSLKDDMAEVEKLAKKFKDKEIDLVELEKFLENAEQKIRQVGLKKENCASLKKIAKLRKMLYGPSPNAKMILETATILKNSALKK